MKYTRLTREQLEELHTEFITFLATQSITGKEWAKIKINQPEIAEQQIDLFSDLIWEKVLGKAKFLESMSPDQLFLFELADTEMNVIVVKISEEHVDLTTSEGLQWLQDNIASDSVEFFTASKTYSGTKNADIFELINQGAEITEGALFKSMNDLIN